MSLTIRSNSFRHGIHPDDHKEQTAELRIERVPFVATYVLPLSQNLGAPSQSIVRKGEAVRRGQKIARPGGYVSTALHSPVTGTVRAIEPRRHPDGRMLESIVIDADPYDPQLLPDQPPIDWESLTIDEFVTHVQEAGLVGMGGAAFPSHVKYKLPDGKKIETLVVNGCECEPFLTADHRLMVEEAARVVRGSEILAAKIGATKTVIGVEKNKPDGVKALQKVIGDRTDIEVAPLRVKYPQGAEKMLIKALFDLEVPSGKLPLDVGVIVNNVATMAAIADYFDHGIPLIERIVTVSGPGTGQPANLLVPIGTPIRALLSHCEAITEHMREVIAGGPMMGLPLMSIDVPVLKGTSGLLVFTKAEQSRLPEFTCVKCSRCLEACPAFLNPSRFGRLAHAERWDEIEEYFVMDCIECGSCTYTCPSNIPIVQLIRVAKSAIRKKNRKK